MNKNRLEKISKDFVSYYSERMELGKALFVCIDRLICIVMKNYAEKFWQEEIERLNNLLPSCSDSERERIKKKIERMKGTQMAYVISNPRNLKDEKLKYYGNISKEQNFSGEKEIKDKFKEKGSSLKIAFVCQKWLTGFDVKCLSFLFLDRPIKEHSLMQAIARPNRRDVGKDRGLIIDYIKNAKNIIESIKDYSGENALKTIEELRQEIISCLEWIENFFSERNIPFEELLSEKDTHRKRNILKGIIERMRSLQNSEKSSFRKQFLNLHKYFSFLDKKQCQEFKDKFEAIKEIDRLLSLQAGEKDNYFEEKSPEDQGKINKYVESEDVKKHLSVENILDLSKVSGNEKQDEKSKLIEKITKDKKLADEEIEENFERKMNSEKRENFQWRINKLIENWNNLVELEIQELKELYEKLKVERQKIKEDSESHLRSGLTISGNAIFEKIKNCDEVKGIEDEKLKGGCVCLDAAMLKTFEEYKDSTFNPFNENRSKKSSGIKSDIRMSLKKGFNSAETELEEENIEFIYNYYKKLFSKRPVWLEQQLQQVFIY
ncbi:Type I site-specific deoxyribonuclease (HsdR), fragment [Mycoplasma suis KI3806]|uniref:Type I site-specific deoxyribonuclease (HsdR) n=1 Tax=Mycoplasma suis (strain KI_3806) TaxID=708248 RepID=F0V3A1_MYCS3|nr:type I restriction endonuclease subunit R [Mycoplasma suis]CBZ40323.1 Type I site-specific deoxyribonuclease (HsdR), fragment [Mycoplasma suis KI3806]